jgi:hypothetical protein
MPNFHIANFLENSHSLASSPMIKWTKSINSGTTLFSTLDYLENQQVLIVAKTTQLPKPGNFLQLCGSYESDEQLSSLRIFYAEEVRLLAN